MIFILKVTLTEYFSQSPQNDIYLNFIHSQNLSVLNLLNRNPNRTVIIILHVSMNIDIFTRKFRVILNYNIFIKHN